MPETKAAFSPDAPVQLSIPPVRPRITILLATYNGAQYLPDQLASYVAQRDVAWDLWVSDDGSTDNTRAIIDAFRVQHGTGRDIRLLEGPRAGAAANFMSLLTHPDLPLDGPVALSDQDDVWHPDKLSTALAALHASGPMTLYSAQCFHTDAALNVIGLSRPPPRAPSFRNALVQNVVSGHSLVMDAQARALVRAAGLPRGGIPYHDWWLYQLISGAGGHIHVDTARMNHYRQHDTNVMGAHEGLRATLHRCAQVLGRTYGGWIDANIAALNTITHLLTPENRILLRIFTDTRPGPARCLAFWRGGLYRQTRLASASFYLAAMLGRV
ncbi:glycosyltransferase [Phaeobacter sp. J2-8]|uniref:glycosyltransferase n=1 Tax=Phaeobacter sp. J2-8 TaxID=2931394 RepID=UPI001FCFB124|nr:glycosyltransferase [Phaeobacter sp. J2-8]